VVGHLPEHEDYCNWATELDLAAQGLRGEQADRKIDQGVPRGHCRLEGSDHSLLEVQEDFPVGRHLVPRVVGQVEVLLVFEHLCHREHSDD